MPSRPPPNPVIFFNERLTPGRLEEGCFEKAMFMYFRFCRELSNDDVGVARVTPYFRRIGPKLVSKPAFSFKKSWGEGATVERVSIGARVGREGDRGAPLTVFLSLFT